MLIIGSVLTGIGALLFVSRPTWEWVARRTFLESAIREARKGDRRNLELYPHTEKYLRVVVPAMSLLLGIAFVSVAVFR